MIVLTAGDLSGISRLCDWIYELGIFFLIFGGGYALCFCLWHLISEILCMLKIGNMKWLSCLSHYLHCHMIETKDIGPFIEESRRLMLLIFWKLFEPAVRQQFRLYILNSFAAKCF